MATSIGETPSVEPPEPVGEIYIITDDAGRHTGYGVEVVYPSDDSEKNETAFASAWSNLKQILSKESP